MENRELLEKVARLGLPLLEAQEGLDVNQTLADVVKARNYRFFEGFPVMLANVLQDKKFDYRHVESLLKNKADKKLFEDLYLFSLALLKDGGLHVPSVSGTEKQKMEVFKGALRYGKTAKVGDYQLSTERLKHVFMNYYLQKTREARSLSDKSEEMSLEFSLSQVFSPKQKDLFLKKLKGEVLTKTEREYFSRTVKKKAAALANSELHHLAQRVVQG